MFEIFQKMYISLTWLYVDNFANKKNHYKKKLNGGNIYGLNSVQEIVKASVKDAWGSKVQDTNIDNWQFKRDANMSMSGVT